MERPTALVTGAGIRIGRAIALELAATGFEVAVHYRTSKGPAETVVAEIQSNGDHGFAIGADLTTIQGCTELADALSSRWGRLDVLVNNASIFGPEPFESVTPESWEQMIGINLRAPFFLSQQLLPLLRAAQAKDVGGPGDQGGLVVHLCDIGADRPVKGYSAYSISKAGLVMLVRAMAIELAPRVRTVGISPGQVIWPENYDQQLRTTLARRIPMGRADGVEDVARLVKFFATEAFYLNGIVVPVDGGLSCRY